MELGVTGTLLLSVCVSLILYAFTWRRKLREKNLPPGPSPLPVLGTMLHLSTKEMPQSLMKLSEIYGPVFTIYLSSVPTVVLVGYDCMKEALVNQGDTFGIRGEVELGNLLFKGCGVILTNGERWKQMRRFSLSTLRNFGMGKRSIEERIQEEAHYLVEEFRKNGDAPFDPTHLLSLAVSNVICSVVFRERFDYKDEKFRTLLALIREISVVMASAWGIEKDNPRTEFHFDNLFGTVIDLFFAGTETTSTTLKYGLLILLKYPDVQRNIQEEIDHVIGQNRCPSVEDRINMPYTDAVVHEIQRFADISPISLPHATSQDTTFRGYNIPKGTLIFPMLTSVLKDPKHFKNPKQFDPKHFLDENDCFKNNEAFLPFSLGFSMDSSWIVAVLLTVITCNFIYLTWDTMYRKRNLPPGPTPLPLVGTLLYIKRGGLVNSLMKLWEKYGPVYTLYFGPRPVVVVCGYEAVKEALVERGEDFGSRGHLPSMERFTKTYGISFSNGKRWRIMRTFTLKTLKSFGFGKKGIEESIQTEAQYVVEEFRKLQGLSLDPTKRIMDAIYNVLCSIIFGERFDYEDEQFTRLLRIVKEIFHIASSPWGQLHNILPAIMNNIPGPHQKTITFSEELSDYVLERVKASQETLDPSSPRHFIDSFLIKIDQEKNDLDTEFNIRNLLVTAHNLFLAGIETVSNTLRHGLLIILKYPEIQAQLHEEIDRVIGRDRVPNFDDRMQMHYTHAVMHEVQRFCDILPLSLPHMVTKDTLFRGYMIPKDTEVYPLLCTVHRDPKYFSTPDKFNPNHFLDEEGKFKKNDAMMAFSAGKRICPGENLARMELFIFLTTILQNFKLTSKTEFTESDIAPKMSGFSNVPINYELLFVPR
ncbi:cytochrome P450 2G1-like isoform X2 [Mixophyes fleayi]|uniref:cytochrome P450 2G1-like isoform X2 n=1 Tax=Mixophyes fleayi TaxID=3061075 RepID=UPI003F4DF57F